MQRLAPDGFMDVAAGRIATIVTSLEMTRAPDTQVVIAPMDGVDLIHVAQPAVDWYRHLFRSVGQEWLWFSRLRLSEPALAAIIQHPEVEVHVLTRDGCEIGFFELDFRDKGACEIAFFGLVPLATGQRLGGYMMRTLMQRAWSLPIDRLWVHTCTLDHPSALAFYQRMGFRAFRQQVEIAEDPRLRGELPRNMGPHVPIID
jgi:GNAT superfamily N-acetyltransferase